MLPAKELPREEMKLFELRKERGIEKQWLSRDGRHGRHVRRPKAQIPINSLTKYLHQSLHQFRDPPVSG